MPRWRRWAERALRDDSGSASLEFLTVGVLLLVPLVFGLLPTTVAFALWPGIHVLQVGF